MMPSNARFQCADMSVVDAQLVLIVGSGTLRSRHFEPAPEILMGRRRVRSSNKS